MGTLASYRSFHTKRFDLCMAVIIFVLLNACKNETDKHEGHQTAAIKTRTDSMPGMDMSPEVDSLPNETYWLSLPTNQTVVARQQAVRPVVRDTVFSTMANGYITYDARRNQKVPVRVGGRIEKLYVKYNYQYVHRAQKILELYSPELNTYIDEYLYVRKNTSDSLLQNKAKEKLLLLGLTSLQVKQLDNSGKASFTISIYSPVEGYVLFDPSGSNASMEAQTSSSPGMSMSSGASTMPSIRASGLSDNSIREGMYVSKDQTLFWINDFREVWGVLAFNQQSELYIKKGQAVVIRSELLPDQSLSSVIQFTEPVYQQGQKFTYARVYISNDKGMLKQNSLITASVFLSAKAMTIPASSVIHVGRASIVWVNTGTTKEGSNVFQSRVVKVGRTAGDQVEILRGLQADETVAKDAAYLADSETIIQY